MEGGLQQMIQAICVIPAQVSILVLMEGGLQPTTTPSIQNTQKVSILVLMEGGLQHPDVFDEYDFGTMFQSLS